LLKLKELADDVNEADNSNGLVVVINTVHPVNLVGSDLLQQFSHSGGRGTYNWSNRTATVPVFDLKEVLGRFEQLCDKLLIQVDCLQIMRTDVAHNLSFRVEYSNP
jgi:hypothetical protein